jgi:hypothetical protein
VTSITYATDCGIYDEAFFAGRAGRALRGFSGIHMDRMTKATLWIAFLVLFSYFAWFYLDCAMDDTCHLVCHAGGRGGCYTKRTPDLKTPASP